MNNIYIYILQKLGKNCMVYFMTFTVDLVNNIKHDGKMLFH